MVIGQTTRLEGRSSTCSVQRSWVDSTGTVYDVASHAIRRRRHRLRGRIHGRTLDFNSPSRLGGTEVDGGANEEPVTSRAPLRLTMQREMDQIGWRKRRRRRDGSHAAKQIVEGSAGAIEKLRRGCTTNVTPVQQQQQAQTCYSLRRGRSSQTEMLEDG